MAKSKEEKQTQQSSEHKEREGAAAPEAERRTRAVVVAVVRDGQSVAQTEEFLSELEFLAETADIDTVCRFTQRLPQPSARLYVGPGTIEEIAAYCADNEIDVAIFDDELSPSQTRNIEKALVYAQRASSLAVQKMGALPSIPTHEAIIAASRQ